MRRCRTALTPVLLRPFNWQTDESWRLYKLPPVTDRTSADISVRVRGPEAAEVGGSDAMAPKMPGEDQQLNLQVRDPTLSFAPALPMRNTGNVALPEFAGTCSARGYPRKAQP